MGSFLIRFFQIRFWILRDRFWANKRTGFGGTLEGEWQSAADKKLSKNSIKLSLIIECKANYLFTQFCF